MEFDSRKTGRILAVVVAAAAILRFVFPRVLTPERHLLVYDAIAAAGGAGLLVAGFALLRRKRVIENVPRSRIRSVAMGFAELAGTARPGSPLVAPISGVPCVYYRYLVEEEHRTGRGRREWRTIDRGESALPFHLEDGTGALLVDPEGAQTVLRLGFRKIEKEGGWLARRKRYSEWRVIPGQRVLVAGTVRKTRDAAQESRAELKRRLVALKRDAGALAAFDADRDGRIDTEEWGNAVRAVRGQVLQDEVARPKEPPEDSIVIGKGGDESTFVIADRSEESLLRRLAWQSGAALAAGAALLLVFAVSILARSGILRGAWVFPW